MKKNTLSIMAGAGLILSLITFAGCTKSVETVKTENANQTAVVINNNAANISAPATPLPSPPANISNSTNIAVNKNKSTTPAVKEPTPEIGSGASDLFLFTQARTALSSDKDLLTAVIIEMKEGNAVLSGSVPNEAQKTKAGQLVQSVKGIKSVKNNIRVAP